MIRLKEIVLSKNNIRQAMLDEFGINGMNDAVLPPEDESGIAFKIRFGAEYRWIQEFRHIEKGQFPGVHVFRSHIFSYTNKMGTFNKLYFDSHFDMNNLHRQVSDRGEMTLGDLVSDLIDR